MHWFTTPWPSQPFTLYFKLPHSHSDSNNLNPTPCTTNSYHNTSHFSESPLPWPSHPIQFTLHPLRKIITNTIRYLHRFPYSLSLTLYILHHFGKALAESPYRTPIFLLHDNHILHSLHKILSNISNVLLVILGFLYTKTLANTLNRTTCILIPITYNCTLTTYTRWHQTLTLHTKQLNV